MSAIAQAQRLTWADDDISFLEPVFEQAAKAQQTDLEKAGPKGYIHGWICVQPPCGASGDSVTHHDHGAGKITSRDADGTMHARFEGGHEGRLGREMLAGDKALDEVRASQPELSKEQSMAVRSYTGFSRRINDYKRKGTPIKAYLGEEPGEVERQMNLISEAVSSSKGIKHDIEVMRGSLNAADLFGKPGSRVGSEFTDAGFVSTSSSQRIAEKFAAKGDDGALIRIKVPRGTKALALPGFESEILLGTGTRFKIVKDGFTTATRGEETKRVRDIVLEVMP